VGRDSLGGVVLVGLLVLAIALGSRALHATPTSGLLADAPSKLVSVAKQAGGLTGIDANVLLAVSKVECNFGRCRSGQLDSMVPPDVRSHVDPLALKPGGSTATMLGLSDGRRIGDWVNPQPVAGGQHAMGFMQFLPTTWRQEAAAAPGRPSDPYKPYDSMVVAGSYLTRLQSGAEDDRHRNLSAALSVYGGNAAYADHVLDLAGRSA
jgi:membrane-bound lytic murein transglycosylase B